MNVSPASVFTSMFTAKIKAGGGPVRPSFTTHSAIAIVPPGASAANVLASSSRGVLRLGPDVAAMREAVLRTNDELRALQG